VQKAALLNRLGADQLQKVMCRSVARHRALWPGRDDCGDAGAMKNSMLGNDQLARRLRNSASGIAAAVMLTLAAVTVVVVSLYSKASQERPAHANAGSAPPSSN
jgi:hypothetical protein